MISEMQAYRPYLQWIALNTLIWPISNIVFAAIVSIAGVISPPVFLDISVNFAIGFVIGLTQWLFLKKYYPLQILWILTIAGSYIFFGLMHWLVGEFLAGSINWIAGGFFAGLSQYFLLRKIFQKPFLWFLVSLVAALLCFWALTPSYPNLFLFHGTIYGAITLFSLGLKKRDIFIHLSPDMRERVEHKFDHITDDKQESQATD